MRTFLVAAAGPTTILLTAALVVLVCFWLLVAVGVADVDSFDTDLDLRGWRLDGVPVAVAFSLLTVLAWSLSVGAAVALAVSAPQTPANGLLRLIVPVGALLVAWVVTCLIVRRRGRHRPFSDEIALSVLSAARTGDGTGSRDAGGPDPYGGASSCTALRPGDRAA